MYYRICPNCGAYLDADEKCDCEISGDDRRAGDPVEINRKENENG